MFKEFLNKNGPSSKIMAQNQNLSNFLTFVSKELDEARQFWFSQLDATVSIKYFQYI